MIEKQVLIIGAGPAGATAAKECAKRDIDTLLIEKRQEIGTPIRCAEGIGKAIEDYVEIKEEHIAKDVVGAKIYSPEGNYFEMKEEVAGNEVGYILDRKRFDRYLVEEAIEQGAKVKLRTRAYDLSRKDNEVITKVKINGKKEKIKSKIVVAADGVESRIGKLTNKTQALDLGDVVSCAQYLVTGLKEIDLDYTHFYIGKEIAPGGYAWIFPKGENKANIGLGIQPVMAKKKPIEYLDNFMEKLDQGKSKVVEEMFGAVPVASPLDEVTGDNFILVGDAARQADPITGGGIMNAIKASKIASKAIEEAINKGDYSKESLNYYEEKRKTEIDELNERNYQLKEIFQGLSNEEYNSIVNSLEGFEFDKISVQSIVTKLLEENPIIAQKISEVL